MQAGLYITATPIGNLKDITLRALEVLKAVDSIICEDTRVTAKLLGHYGIEKKLIVYNDHSDELIRAKIIEEIKDGKAYALVSDAGTPLISDPGYKLVRECHENGVYVTTLPGASSVISAITISGLPSDSFLFAGFLPQKSEAKRKLFSSYKNIDTTLIFFDRGSRLVDSLNVALEVFGDIECAITREISKLYEEVRLNKISELLLGLKNLDQNIDSENIELRGEIVVLFSNKQDNKSEISEDDLNVKLADLLKNNSVKDAAAIAADLYGIKKKEAYELLLRLKG